MQQLIYWTSFNHESKGYFTHHLFRWWRSVSHVYIFWNSWAHFSICCRSFLSDLLLCLRFDIIIFGWQLAISLKSVKTVFFNSSKGNMLGQRKPQFKFFRAKSKTQFSKYRRDLLNTRVRALKIIQFHGAKVLNNCLYLSRDYSAIFAIVYVL